MASVQEHKGTKLLDEKTNLAVKNSLGDKRTSMVTAVAKSFITSAPDHKNWISNGSGVIMLIRDANLRTYTIRFQPLTTTGNIIEVELYCKMNPVETTPGFLNFEGLNCVLGFHFLDETEFQGFITFLFEKLMKQIKTKKKNSSHVATKSNKSVKIKKVKEVKPKKGSKKVLEIGAPQEFRQISHIGNDNIEESQELEGPWKILAYFLFGTHKVTAKEAAHLNIYVSQNGGIDRFVAALEKTQKYKTMGKDAKGNNEDPIKVRDSKQNKSQKAPKIKKEKLSKKSIDIDIKLAKQKSVDSSQVGGSLPPSRILTRDDSVDVSESTSVCNESYAPPPPLAPPPVSGPPCSAPRPPPKIDNKSAPLKASSTNTSKLSLLDQIQKGKDLKKVEITEIEEVEEAHGILGALATNLAAFRQRMNVDDGDESSECEQNAGNDSDWD